MKPILVGAALALAVRGLAQTHLTISQGGKLVGYATTSVHLEADGSKVVETRMELKGVKDIARITSRSAFTKDGAPIRKYQQVITPGLATKETVVTFDKDGASVVILDGDARSTKKVPLVATAPRANPAEFWFIRDNVAAPASVTCYIFDASSLEWQLATYKYTGDKSIAKRGTAHEVIMVAGEREVRSWLDDRGLPILVAWGDMRMEKIWPK